MNLSKKEQAVVAKWRRQYRQRWVAGGLHSTARVTQRIATVSQAYRPDSRVRPTVARALAMRRRFSYTECH
jgi:hypothetical protein